MNRFSQFLAAIVLFTGASAHGALVSHFTFDNSGALGDDRGAFNNDVSGNIGTPAFTGAAAVGGGALDLNGSSALIVPNAPRYTQLDDNGDGFTVSAWVNRDAVGGVQRFFSTAMGGGFVGQGWGVGTNGNNFLATTYGVVDYNQPSAVPTGTYQHVAYTYSFNGTGLIDSVKFYLNGSQVANLDLGPDGMNNLGGGQMTIGNLNLPGNPQFYNGSLDDLRIYNQELSDGRIADLASKTTRGSIVVPTLHGNSSNLNSFNVGTPDKLTDNSGLNVPVLAGATLVDAEVATHQFDGGFAQSWVTNANSSDYFSTNPNPVFVWDLGENMTIEDILLWQYQNNGGNGTNIGNDARTFELRFSTDAEGAVFTGAADFSGTLASVIAMGNLNLAQSFNLAGITDAQIARYVELTLTDNYFGQPGITGGGDRVGLGEIRFNASSIVPEPATASLLVLSAGMFLRRRRNA